ncbi:hypothetical protein [Listeria rocourtiae]|uniref:hypothetical protein n=1 Tax=Listeria rocourtiae TaxID=647910 RepID=UPI003D2F7DE0
MTKKSFIYVLAPLIMFTLTFISSTNVSATVTASDSTQTFLKVTSIPTADDESSGARALMTRAISKPKYYKYQWTRGSKPLMYVRDVIHTKETSSYVKETSRYQQSGYILPYYAAHKGLSRSSSGTRWIKYQSKKVMSIKYPTPWGQMTLIKNNLVDYRTVKN